MSQIDAKIPLLVNPDESKKTSPLYPGQSVVTDGNSIICRVAYKVNGGISIYTITPSSPFGEQSAQRAALGEKNIYGVVPQVFMACDEAAAASFVQGLAAKGVGSATCSSSQGILLMIPEMYNSAGQLLPITFYIGARDLSRHSLTIFAGHSDVYAVRDTGIAILFAADAQELQDIGAIAERLKWEASLPVAVVYDGFLTTHRQTQVQELPEEFFWSFMPHDKMVAHKERSLDPSHPSVWGTNENPDGYMQAGLAQRPHTLRIEEILPSIMDEFAELTGRNYNPYQYTGHPQATDVIVAAGSSVTTLRSTVDYLLRRDPERKIGVLNVRAFRPFLTNDFIEALPAGVERIAVLDRSMTHTAQDEPLCADVRSAVMKAAQGFRGVTKLERAPIVTGGIYGVAGKDFHPGSVLEVFNHLQKIADTGDFWTGFTVGVIDDLMGTSLPPVPAPDIFEDANVRQGRIVAYGSDGTVSMVKGATQIYSSQPNPDNEGGNLHIASTAEYDSKKAGGVTVSHFRVSTQPLDESFDVRTPDYVAVHHPALLNKRDGILNGIRKGGRFIINTPTPPEKIFEALPQDLQRIIIDEKLELWVIDAFKIAEEQGLGRKISMIMQRILLEKFGFLDHTTADALMEDGIVKAFGRKGQHVVDNNVTAFKKAIAALKQVPIPESVTEQSDLPRRNKIIATTADLGEMDLTVISPDMNSFINSIQEPGMAGRGSDVSVRDYFNHARGGARPTDTWKGLDRNFATRLPKFEPFKCNDCGDCVFMCPTGGALDQAILSARELSALKGESLLKVFRNAGRISQDASAGPFGLKRLQSDDVYGLAVDANLCTGCGVCEAVCNKDAIKLVALDTLDEEQLTDSRRILDISRDRGADIDLDLDLSRPFHTTAEMESLPNYIGASGACAGCYEPLYVAKFLQLFPYTVISNATGCSSIWGAQAYETPYSTDKEGFGAAWVNPLFENNAAVGGGIALGMANERDQTDASCKYVLGAIADNQSLATEESFIALTEQLEAVEKSNAESGLTLAARIDQVNNIKQLQVIIDKTIEQAPVEDVELLTHLRLLRSTVTSNLQKNALIVGGDGWAFDIGLQMLIHVLQSDLDVVVMVLVTDAYSNTGGQMSKATPKGMDTPFAPGGKSAPRYSLGTSIAYTGHTYVGQVNLAFPNHLINTYKQAVEYKGPSLLLCYVPCMTEQKFAEELVADQARKATTTRYWPLWAYNPTTDKWNIDSNQDRQRRVARFEGDFINDFCRVEGRFRTQFNADGEPSDLLISQLEDNLQMWDELRRNAEPKQK